MSPVWQLSARAIASVRALVLRDTAMVKKEEGEAITVKWSWLQ